MNSKAKGSAGERELCAYLAARGFPAHRNDQMFVGGRNNPDIDAEGLEGFHFEVKRVEKLNVPEAMKQAIRDASGRVPVVVHRRNREPWLVTMRLDDWILERRNAHSSEEEPGESDDRAFDLSDYPGSF
jgi:Holliday junction resolvase